MDHDSNHRNNLIVFFRAYCAEKVPSGLGEIKGINDCDIDLYDEDAYIAGIVTSFLSGAEVSVTTITLDRSIDRRFAMAAPKDDFERAKIEDSIEYRRKMNLLAILLSKAAEIPIAEINA